VLLIVLPRGIVPAVTARWQKRNTPSAGGGMAMGGVKPEPELP
jgi:hypothetical protein